MILLIKHITSTSIISLSARLCLQNTRRGFVMMPGGFGTMDEFFGGSHASQPGKCCRCH